MQFDAAILIDPFWDANNLGPKCTKKFKELYDYLAKCQLMVFEDDDEVPKLSRLNEPINHHLYRLCLGRGDCRACASFLDGGPY